MSKRIRKKKHKELCYEVMTEMSLLSDCRRMIDQAEANTPILMTEKRCIELLTPWLYYQIKRYRLKIAVVKRTFEEDKTAKEVLFIIYSIEFPQIRYTSFNNLNII